MGHIKLHQQDDGLISTFSGVCACCQIVELYPARPPSKQGYLKEIQCSKNNLPGAKNHMLWSYFNASVELRKNVEFALMQKRNLIVPSVSVPYIDN